MMTITRISHDSEEYRQLTEFRGESFRRWVDYWESVPPREKDVTSHPVWIMSMLKSRALLAEQLHYEDLCLFVFSDDHALFTIIPFHVRRLPFPFQRYSVARQSSFGMGISPAVRKEQVEAVVTSIFSMAGVGEGRTLMVTFPHLIDTSSLLRYDANAILEKSGHTKSVLELRPDYLTMISRPEYQKLRANIRRGNRRIAESGTVEYAVIEEGEQLRNVFKEFIELEVNGWKSSSPYAMKNNAITDMFYSSLVEGFSRCDATVVFTLRLDDKLVASELGIVLGDVMYGLKRAYDEKYAKYSPGTLLLDHIFGEYFPRKGIRYNDALGPAEWFRDIWHTDTRETYMQWIFPDTFAGKCMKLCRRAMNSIRGVPRKKH